MFHQNLLVYIQNIFMQYQSISKRPQIYQDNLSAFSAVSMDRQDLEIGNKVLLPGSVIQQILHRKSKGPMIFRITSSYNARSTYVGFLEFIAEEGTAILPNWIFDNLQLEEGNFILINQVDDLPKGKRIKLQPHETAFIDLSDPRAVLENSLRNYICLTEGETIKINFAGKSFMIDIKNVEPKSQFKAININDADVEIDFEQPLDYDEKPPDLLKKSSSLITEEVKTENGIKVFVGNGVRLDGKKQIQEEPKQQYNPRLHKLKHGDRNQNAIFFSGEGQKVGALAKRGQRK